MKGLKCFAVFLGLISVAISADRPSTEETEKRLIQTSEHDPPIWMSEEEVLSLHERRITFMDVTGIDYSKVKSFPANSKALPTTLRYETVVRNSFTQVSSARIQTFMTQFSSFYNRHYRSNYGVNSSNWLFTQVQGITRDIGSRAEVNAWKFDHSFEQPSVIARIWGSDPILRNEVVILGAHQDSLAGGVNGQAPGADDNASGSGALLEAFRALLLSGFNPKRSIEFQWYAGEEAGLLGSQHIATTYSNLGTNVISMLNFDVVGYNTPGNTNIRLRADYVDSGLNSFLRLIINNYLGLATTSSTCGYGCSDHASWYMLGVPAAGPTEPIASPYMHTTRDTLDTVSYAQISRFSQLAVAYAIEIAEPQ